MATSVRFRVVAAWLARHSHPRRSRTIQRCLPRELFTDNFASNAPGVNSFFVSGSNIAPGETLNGGNLFTQAAANNVGLINGFKNNQTLAQIQANVPFFSPPSLFSANKQTRIAQFQKWSLEVQQAIGKNSSFDVAYNGNHSIHDLVDRNGVNSILQSGGWGLCERSRVRRTSGGSVRPSVRHDQPS